jgi:hypothetical protein
MTRTKTMTTIYFLKNDSTTTKPSKQDRYMASDMLVDFGVDPPF